jgi:N-methylhydantoinase A
MFDAEHQRLFGFSMEGQRHEIINLRCSVSGSLGDPQEILKRFVPAFPASEKPPVRVVQLFDEITRCYVDANVYLRTDLARHQKIEGPAIVMSSDSTVYVPADSDAVVDTFGNILIDIGVKQPPIA